MTIHLARPAGPWVRRAGGPAAVVLAVALLWGIRPGDPARSVPPPSSPGPPLPVREGPGLEPHLLLAADSAALERATGALDAAMGLRRSQRHEEAEAAFLSIAATEPALADWARALALDLQGRRGDTTAVRLGLEALPSDLAAGWGWRARVQAHLAAGDPAGARRVALAARDALPDPADRTIAGTRAAEAALVAGDTADARILLLEAASTVLRVTSPGVRTLPPSAERTASLLASLGPRTPDEWRALARLHLRLGSVRQGVRELDRQLAGLPGTDPTWARGQLEAAEALFAGRAYDDAERRFRLAGGSGDPGAAPEGKLGSARILLRTGRLEAARTALTALVRAHGGHTAAAEAWFLLADLDHDAGDLEAAREGYRRSLALAPTSEAGADAAMRLGGLALVERNDLEAVQVFERFRDAHPGGWRFQQATFWAAMAYRALGEEVLARERLAETVEADPASYYGVRASDLLGRPDLNALLPPSPPSDPILMRAARGALGRIDALQRLGLAEQAAHERARAMRWLAARPGGLHALAERYHERDRLLEGVRLGREIHGLQGYWDPRLLRVVYPFPFRERIVADARRRGIDPYLVAGLIRQESLFEPGAVSTAGAVGLMQLLPRTGQQLARRDGLGRFEAAMLREPEVNIRLGTLHLADLLTHFGGRVPDVLAAYNAGHGRLARWRLQPEYAEPELFSERIPYRETREYVRTVQENARIYSALYRAEER